ncbi:peroxisomal ATPase PEX1 isoform X1 [Ostrinia nubilalis]|uniref:peroxisomal ATPase PEX1 isoform X1 n=1 Tax=Ostrinia nubilalis TaxID=29057 RepID=UPI0030824B84
MLGGAKLKVVYTHEKTCFAYISPKYSTNNEKSQCVQVLLRDKHVLLWVVYSSSVTEGQIACNPIFSRLVGLEEGWEVFVSPYGDVKVLDELYIDTDSPDDQEILEHNVELLQLRILDQLRLVVSNQKAVVWISTSLPIVFTPKQTGLLVTNSRIVVKVDAFNSFHAPPPTTSNVPKLEDSKLKNIGIINKGILQPYLYTLDRLVLRALPIDSDGKKNLIHPYIVFIHEDLLGEKYKHSTVVLATMQNIPSILQENNDNENNNNKMNDLCVEIVPVDSVVFKSLCHEDYNSNIHTVLIPKALNAIINIENGTRIIFTIIGDKVEQPEHIDIVTYSDMTQTESEVIEKFKNCVIENTHSGKKFLINDGVVKQNTQISKGFLQFKLKPEKLRYTLLNTESFRHCTVAAKCLTDCDLDIPKTPMSNLEYDYKNYCRTMKSMESLVQKIVSHAYFEIHREATFKNVSEIKSNILLTGLSGTGKSAICHIVQKELTLWTRVVQCRSLKGRKDIPEALSAAVLSCRERRPAVLVCDDVDALLPANTEGASPQDIAYYQRLAVVLKQLLQTCSGVCVLMTAQSVKALHPTLRQFSGKPLFTAHFDILELEQEERTELFKHLLNEKIREEFSVEDDDVIKLAMDTAGSNVRDITDYLNKKIFKAVKKKKANPDTKPRLVEDVTKDVEKKSAFDIWEPVGGLDDVKRELTECIFWPMMYPALFPSQSCGILLYGPPGTGKSHIGSCLARVANMSLVAVKGPELLSKYIGQSEKAVRDIFDKADMKRPCILFFDEFDSLAPKRGHDSTGVTDRVVNQLLARLDGAEGGARGPVLAATSRPDLLDPALLRAGRLQRHVYCALPAQVTSHPRPDLLDPALLRAGPGDVTPAPRPARPRPAARRPPAATRVLRAAGPGDVTPAPRPARPRPAARRPR